jgi:hypothetical protein
MAAASASSVSNFQWPEPLRFMEGHFIEGAAEAPQAIAKCNNREITVLVLSVVLEGTALVFGASTSVCVMIPVAGLIALLALAYFKQVAQNALEDEEFIRKQCKDELERLKDAQAVPLPKQDNLQYFHYFQLIYHHSIMIHNFVYLRLFSHSADITLTTAVAKKRLDVMKYMVDLLDATVKIQCKVDRSPDNEGSWDCCMKLCKDCADKLLNVKEEICKHGQDHQSALKDNLEMVNHHIRQMMSKPHNA